MTKGLLKAAGVVALATSAVGGWYYATRPGPEREVVTAPAMASAPAAAPAPGPTALTLAAAGPQTLHLTVVPYAGGPELQSATDPTGVSSTLQDIYTPVGLGVQVSTEPQRPDPGAGWLTMASLSSLAVPRPAAGGWHVTAFMLPRGRAKGDRGVMFADASRDRIAIFAEGNPTSALVLRTAAHELGHALNLFHADGDADPDCCDQGVPKNGTTLMNRGTCFSAQTWRFDLGTRAIDHLLHHPLQHVQPGGSMWGTCVQGHDNTCR